MIYPPFDFQIVEINDLYVFTTKGEVPRRYFDEWLSDTGRLEWELNSSDHTGAHVQQSGVMDLDTYYQHPHYVIIADIIDYSRDYMKLIASQRPTQSFKLRNLATSFQQLKNIMDDDKRK